MCRHSCSVPGLIHVSVSGCEVTATFTCGAVLCSCGDLIIVALREENLGARSHAVVWIVV